MTSLSLSANNISYIEPLNGLNGLYYLFLEGNKIEDLSSLVKMVKEDKEQRFAPYLNLYLKDNPLSAEAKDKQLPAIKEVGVRLNK